MLVSSTELWENLTNSRHGINPSLSTEKPLDSKRSSPEALEEDPDKLTSPPWWTTWEQPTEASSSELWETSEKAWEPDTGSTSGPLSRDPAPTEDGPNQTREEEVEEEPEWSEEEELESWGEEEATDEDFLHLSQKTYNI